MRITAMALAIALLALPGCQEDRISGPTVADFKAARQELAAKNAKSGKKPQAVAKTAEAPPAAQSPVEGFLGANVALL